MQSIILALLTFLIVGCAAPIHKISLHSYPSSINNNKISVIDSRLDKQVYITGLSITGTHIYMYEVEPDLTEALSGSIQSSLEGHTTKFTVAVNIEELDIKNKVGFGTKDQISCIIESKVTIGSNGGVTIKTMSINDENLSPLLTTSGKIIVDQCIKDHGRDIAALVNENG